MTEEYIYERERNLLDYFRNNITDPTSRGTTTTYVTTGTGGQRVFTFPNTYVKNVADTITVSASTKRKGANYTVAYGTGSASSTISFTANTGTGVSIAYHYGTSMIEREFSRSDAKLPRIVIMFLTGSEELAGLGDSMESTRGSYFNASYRIEIRSKYADQARELSSQAFNLARKMRRAGLYRTLLTTATDMQNFDFDPDKDCYIWQFTLNVQWEITYQ